jgi:hypothetical protein
MNTVRNITYGIILDSLILVGIVQRERQNTLAASTEIYIKYKYSVNAIAWWKLMDWKFLIF